MTSDHSVPVSPVLMREIEQLAEQRGVSVERWIHVALLRQIGLEEPAEAFFARRAARAKPGSVQDALSQVADRPPTPDDELPEGYSRARSAPDAA